MIKYELINEKWLNIENMQLKILNMNSYCYETNIHVTWLYFEWLLKNTQTLKNVSSIHHWYIFKWSSFYEIFELYEF